MIVVGIDQSYTETGITVMQDSEVKLFHGVRNPDKLPRHVYRDILKQDMHKICQMVRRKNDDTMFICERVRLKSGGFISLDSISTMIELTALIKDVTASYGYELYTVDTRSWKSAIVGTTAGAENDMGIHPKKYRTIMYVQALFLNKPKLYNKLMREVHWTTRNGVALTDLENKKKYVWDDNICDSYCIAKYGFLPDDKRKLEVVK